MAGERTLDLEKSETLKAVLLELSQVVLPELQTIKKLFVEYTPHDDRHIQNLFSIRSKVLGATESKLSNLERFILDAAIWSHDWGMAVSEFEKTQILNCIEPGVQSLVNERELIEQFMTANELRGSEPGMLAKKEFEGKWVDYVRNTHHLRSGLRIRKWFGPANADLGKAISTVAECHGMEFQNLEDEQFCSAYDFIGGQRVNIRALAVYLRIIDWLDIAKNRTPYEMWKTLSPRNKRSAMEWRKHAAMRPPAEDPRFPNALVFIAEPEDAQTLAELYHLRKWITEEIARGRSLLRKSSEASYVYDLEQIEFRFEPKNGLHDEPVRFEFDHRGTLELLGSELYGRDNYVFIRELVQNAIDASAARSERRMVRQDPLGDTLVVEVKLVRDQGGITNVIVKDSGTGMDLYVVKNYLAMAGASYYRSRDFQKLGLKFDPISRFGIGLLACFGVAESVSVETLTDPALGIREAWKIDIRSAEHYWEIHKLESSSRVGTTVTVTISDSSLRRFLGVNMKGAPVLQVSDYLERVAGMVEVPIEIDEDGRRTAILPRHYDDVQCQPWRDRGFRIAQTSCEIPLEIAIEPLDIEAAKEAVSIETCDLSILGDNEISGVLSFIVPNKGWNVIEADASRVVLADISGDKVTLHGNQYRRQEPLATMHYHSKGLVESDQCDLSMRCHSNGILVPLKGRPEIGHRSGWNGSPVFGAPWLRLNLKRGKTEKIGMDRASFHTQTSESWELPVFKLWTENRAKALRDELLLVSPVARFRRLIELWNYYWISLEIFADVFPIEEWPVAILDDLGRPDVLAWKDVKAWGAIPEAPRMLSRHVSHSMSKWILRGELDKRPRGYPKWKGGRCLVKIHSADSRGIRWPHQVGDMPLLKLERKRMVTSSSRWITPPSIYVEFAEAEAFPPLRQTTHILGSREQVIQGGIQGCLQRVGKAPKCATSLELSVRTNHVGGNVTFVNPDHYGAPEDFKKYCFLVDECVNVLHPVGAFLCQVVAIAEYRGFATTVDSADKTRLARLVRRIPALLHPVSDTSSRKQPATLGEINDCLEAIAHEAVQVQGLLERPVSGVEVNSSDFLPGAYHVKGSGKHSKIYAFTFNNDSFFPQQIDQRMAERNFPEFGQALK